MTRATGTARTPATEPRLRATPVPRRRPLVVGVDGSPTSRQAVTWAAEEAARRSVPLELVAVVPVPSLVPWTLLAGVPVPSEEALERAAAAHLAEAVADLRAIRPDADVSTRCVHGPPGPTLVDLSVDASLLVVGHRGQGGFEQILLGSVAAHVASRSRCPVVVARPLMDRTAPRVVVGIDGSAASVAAARFAFDAASARGHELVALHAWSDPGRHLVRGWADAEWRRAVETQALIGLSETLAGEREAHPDVLVTQRLVHEHPIAALAQASTEAGLLVLGSHGVGAIAGVLLGSVTHEMLRLSRCPVAIVRPDEGHGSEGVRR